MVTALCFITVDPSKVNEVGAEIARLPHVRAVYSVTGQLDIVAILEKSPGIQGEVEADPHAFDGDSQNAGRRQQRPCAGWHRGQEAHQ